MAMAGHPEELSLPGGVTALLGASIVEHTGAGACRVVSGGGLVAKVGPPEVIAREAAVLRTPLPLPVPSLVDCGPDWLVTAAEADHVGPWTAEDRSGALGDLARLHDAFDEAVPDGLVPVLRKPFSAAGVDRLLEPVRRRGLPVTGRLAPLLDDPALLVEAASASPATLLHGDPWPANVLRPAPRRRVWIDWEQASVGPAAADVATWLDQTAWYTGEPAAGDVDTYLAARADLVDRRAFDLALDAATVLWFLAYDVPRLADGPAAGRQGPAEANLTRALAAARRLAFA
jgi:hypothetical protein